MQKLELNSANVSKIINLLQPYLENKLLPFWLKNSIDEKAGGFLSYFDKDGNPTHKTDKTLICQLRMIFTMASAHRAGYGNGEYIRAAEQGVKFVIEHFWDKKYEGWYWITDRYGRLKSDSKIMYGQSFGIYSMSEYTLASGDNIGLEYAEKTFSAIQKNAAEMSSGGYWEMFKRNWQLKPKGVYGGDRKTLDVHMHLMEAFTNLYECSHSIVHQHKLKQVIRLLVNRMLFPEFGTGIAQFDVDFNPLPAILFRDVWGSDRDSDSGARPLNNTNYGHNIELAWLLNHALNIMKMSNSAYLPMIKKLVDHAHLYGIDWKYGGLFVEGPNDGPATQTLKEFWQQSEAWIGFLDALLLFDDSRYWYAFTNIFDFVWNNFINHAVGEWYALLERDGQIKWGYLGHEWKISYHTVRSVIQTIKRLKILEQKLSNKKN